MEASLGSIVGSKRQIEIEEFQIISFIDRNGEFSYPRLKHLSARLSNHKDKDLKRSSRSRRGQ